MGDSLNGNIHWEKSEHQSSPLQALCLSPPANLLVLRILPA